MILTDITNCLKHLRPGRWWMDRQGRRQDFDSTLLERKEILDLHFRVEADRASTVYKHEVEHRTLGDARSVYRGYGMDYDESRPYFPGDELRFMNWRVTARTGEPHMKVFREERKPAVYIVIDRRQNMCFGTRRRLKVAQAVRAAATTAFDARLRHAPVAGVLLECMHDDADKKEPQSKLTWITESNDETGVFNLIHAANRPCPAPETFLQSGLSSENSEQSLEHVIKLLTPMLAQGSRVVLISDFHDLDDNCRSSLLELSMTHHLKAIQIIDPVEKNLPACGSLLLQSENNSTSAINSSDKKIRSRYQAAAQSYLVSKQEMFRSLGIPCHSLMTDDDDIEAIIKV